MSRRFYIAWLSLVTGFYLMSTPCPAASDFARDYLVEVWDTDSGLPHSTVTSIAQTPDGYLWVGTLHGGLARFDGIRFVNFHPGNTPGMKSIEIQKLLVDGEGTLWVGTVEGMLISHRGGRFQVEYQNTQTPQSWLEGLVSRPANGRTNEAWFATVSSWLFHRTQAGGTNLWETQIPLGANIYSAPCQDRDGVVWYRTAGDRLGVLRSNSFSRMLQPPGLRSQKINALVTDAVGQLWVGTEKELAVWDGKQFIDMTPTNGAPDLRVLQLTACRDGSLWVLTPGKLRKCSGRSWVATATPWSDEFDGWSKSSRSGVRLFADSHGGVWVVHYGDGMWNVGGDALWRVGADGQVTRVGEAEGLPNGLVNCWFEDREGNVWVGLAGGGLACVRPRIFHTLPSREGLGVKTVRSICEDFEETMWFGTGGESFLRWRNGELSEITPLDQPTVGLKITVAPAGKGRIWVGSAKNGLLSFADGRFERPIASEDIGAMVRALYTDRSGALWIGNEFGLFRWDHNRLERFTTAEGFSPAFVVAITGDRAGNLWVGTALGELRRFKDGRFETFRPKDSLTDEQTVRAAAEAEPMQSRNRGTLSGGERFWSLHADEDGVIWIGSLGGGLLRFEAGEFTRYTPREGLPSEHISQILEDERGQLWLGTRSGITRASRDELNEFARGERQSVSFITYGRSDGLPVLECSGGSQPACWRSRDGKLWFSTVKGPVWVNPRNLPHNALPPPVVVEEISVDGQYLSAAGVPTAQPGGGVPTQLRVPAGRHYFEFKFTALSLVSPDKMRFRWRLVGVEKNWVEGGNRRTVSYSFIPPGNYEFQVQACNNDGVWNERGATMAFTVLPYFWQARWFPFVATLVLVVGTAISVSLVLRASHRRRLARLEVLRATELERSRIARDLHDELGSGLTEVTMLTAAFPGANLNPDKLRERLRRVGDRARGMVDALDEIVWAVDPGKDNLSAVAKYFAGHVEEYLKESNIACQVQMPVTLPARPLSAELRHHLFLAVREAVSNAVRHARPSRIGFELGLAGNQLQITITDDGCGFDPATIAAGNGLANLRQRLVSVGGRCEIISKPDCGTTIKLVVFLSDKT